MNIAVEAKHEVAQTKKVYACTEDKFIYGHFMKIALMKFVQSSCGPLHDGLLLSRSCTSTRTRQVSDS